ncbi:phosphoglucosamine mutase [Nitratidesulfovibrio vulgaris]|uniref:Phosphoglucosamine mutase n=2 Tax=Nitratidesulfovibrio vulgaris TaxID=881 RepID=GLMM_NITV2|nr:phosphoglucosamine mutase [Nitratidesulfovibrio vulgaris]A1VED4.1 RecName: Full=Phosphoglucosamine mutase [Nitratidesulfovibrio vulgaris DP4]Q72CK1.1 RecName: Full=Phosphoglucosamine mutase [Nitratidesulfovibrio vulgaris str. Hildenborough]GEB79030.1 phosphoglucosamine mutase [Desulfovibrio desulfuricans]HBW15718.1 phosphoglucosamine mutase [Desulfovibrio sp.]AAS95760.1 phosphoglucosamine mutase [Nitratidesulfovibrio vulgaris str. Hildenborough]ABM28800.1 phosphoglucosamine mutase [Nitrati
MGRRLFGTDGLRGQVNIYPMTADMALRLGLAAGTRFRNGNRRHRVVIGKDTRLSGYMFESALTAGLCAAGMDVFQVGPLPTPAISFLTRNMRADLGVVISASHNPFMDNGIKFFDRSGFKLPDDVENQMTDMVLDPDWQWDYPASEKVGRAYKIADAPGRYIVYIKSSFPADLTLDGLRVVIDCANGANYKVAPLALEELGAEVIKLGTEPNGLNINHQCGSLYPEVVAAKVRETRADIGLALDGDADRLIVVDEKGTILDGDQIMALCAQDLMAKGKLPGNMLVATVMSNMALEVFMKEHGGTLLRTAVGDRYVVEAMRQHGALLGGEQSGHLIFREYSTTGDGLLAALQILRIMRERGKPLSELAGQLQLFPQQLINVHVERKIPFAECQPVADAVAAIETELGDRGRVLLRYSGTESVCRVMVEGEHPEQVARLAEMLAETVQKHLR